MEVPSHTMPAESEREKPPCLDLNADREGGQERDTQSGHDRLLDRLRVAQLHGGPAPGAGDLQRPLRHLPSGRPLLSDQQTLSGEQLDSDLPAFGPGMSWGHDEDQLIG